MPTRLSLAVVGTAVASLASLASMPTLAHANASPHEPGKPRSHGAPGGPIPGYAPAARDRRAPSVEPTIDDFANVDHYMPYGAESVYHYREDAYYLHERGLDVGAGEWDGDSVVPGDAAASWRTGDTVLGYGAGHDVRRGSAMHRRAAQSFTDKIAADMASLVMNPKWLAQNPKWTSWGSSGGDATAAATAPTLTQASTQGASTASPSPSVSASKTSSAAASKTSAVVGAAESVAWVLPSPPSSTCAGGYTNTQGGGVYAAQVGNVPWLPRPSTYVVRGGNQLYLDGNEFRIVGPNIYWLGLDENVGWSPSYPSHGRIREAMAISVAMGATTVRSHTLGVSTGHPLTLWPNAYQTNSNAWDTIDYSIWAARNYGLRLIVPLTDNYAYYHGGKYDFIGWAGADTSDGSQFYYNSDVVQIFKDYITVLLNHTNQYTGVKIGEDPTILGFETGNELGGYMLGGGAPPASWTQDIAAHIKSLSPGTLILDGTDGLTTYSGDLGITGLGVSSVDLVTDHFYPALQWLLNKDQGWMNNYSNKVFYVGELDWTGLKGGDDLGTFYSTLENWPGAGSMMWSVFGHDDSCCNYVTHNDGYTLNYPNGLSGDLQAPALALVQHWYRMRGLTPPSALPAVACPQPTLAY